MELARNGDRTRDLQIVARWAEVLNTKPRLRQKGNDNK